MFEYHTIDTAPEESKEIMKTSREAFGFLPNFHKILAESPITYEVYVHSFNSFIKNTTLTPLEAQVVFMSSNYVNRCSYCVAGHTWAMKSAKMPDNVIDALRNGTEIPDEKLEALRLFVIALLEERGHIGKERLEQFFAAGYTKKQALEVLCGLSSKLISNFTNALAYTDVDVAMERYSWTHPNADDEFCTMA